MIIKNKGQISIEVLIILSILIIGATFFSIYYFNAIKPKETPELNLDNRIFNEKINTIENIGDLEPSEDGDEDDPTIPNAFANLDLILIPSGSTNINTNFGIKAVVQDVSGYNSATLLSVTITKDGITSNSCSYNGIFSSNFSDLGNLNLSENNLEISINSFSCNSPGDYMFTFRVNSVPFSTELTSNIIKTIDNSTPGDCTNFTGDLTFSVPSGQQNNSINLILDYVDDPNCLGDIYYTNDGANPTTSSNLYSSPLILSQNIGGGNLIIKANVFGTNSEGNSISANLRTQTYNFKVASPTVSLESGTYSSSQNVALSTITNEAEIRYTTNGSEPSPFSPLYTTPINISTTTTLKIKAFKTGYNSSEVVSRNYIIETESSVCSLSGSGTIFDPYLIRTPFDLHCINEKQIALNLEGPGGVLEYFLLENDIDLKHNSLLPYSWYQSSGFPSIGALGYTDTQWDCYGDFYFKGHFDGGGHTIANVYINREFINQSDVIVDCDPAYSDFTHQKASLFGILSLGSSIKNLNLENIYINLSADQVFQHSLGGLSNRSVTTSQITDVNISGIVKISGNYDADISAQQVGGVVGLNGGLIRNVSFDGNVFGCNNVGGIVGSNDYLGEVILSKAKGLINGAGIGIGGVVGTNKKKVSECFFDGNIVGKNNVGGIVGEHKGLSNSLIENSYVKSNIISSVDTDIYPGRFFGGIVGRVSPNLESELIPVNHIINSYSVSKLPDFSAVQFNSACGGVGYLTGASFVPNYGSGSYYNNLSSLVNPDYCDYMNAHENYGFLGKSTNFMKNLNNFVGWNTGIWIINPSINEGYPYLRNNPPN